MNEVTSGAKEAARLHQRASQWYEDNALLDEAIYHALAAGDWERVAQFIKEHHLEYAIRGEYFTLCRWLRKIPDAVIHRDMRLCFIYGFF